MYLGTFFPSMGVGSLCTEGGMGWDGIDNAKMRFEIWNLRSEI